MDQISIIIILCTIIKRVKNKNLARFLPEFGEISPKNNFDIFMPLPKLEIMR